MVAQVTKLDYETKTLAIANALLMATREKKNLFAQMRDQMRWDDKIMDFAMGNPGLKVQLFRFIDALPALRSKPEIARHLQEYLSAEEVELPGVLKGLLNFTDPDSAPGKLAATTVAPAVETLAYRYISAETIDKAVKAIERMRKDKLAFTMDLLGEAVITEEEAQAYLQRYLDLMEQLSSAARNWKTVDAIDVADGKELPKVQVSVKLTAFYSQFDPLDAEGSRQAVSQHIRTLLRRAKDLGVAVHFDMEQYKYKDLTLAILKRHFDGRGISSAGRHRRHHAGLPAGQLRGSAGPGVLGQTAGHPRYRAPGERGLLGPGDHYRPPERLAQPRLQQENFHRRQL